MKLYFDTEFTGLHKNTTLISIGIIDENNRMFYGVFTDYDKSQVNEWIEKHVIGNLKFELPDSLNIMTYVVGNTTAIRYQLLKWLDEGDYKLIEFVSDVSHYDFVLLIDLLYGEALKMPENVSPTCIDLNADIAKYKNINHYGAFNLNREGLLKGMYMTMRVWDPNIVDDVLSMEHKHNAIYDAIIIKLLYENINRYI